MSDKLATVVLVKGDKAESVFVGRDHEKAKEIARGLFEKPPVGADRVLVMSEKMGTFFHRKIKSLPVAVAKK
jgi:hypothetical protein